ncbi:MAG: hypothetical protein FWE10_04650 [Rikenellaceae bacterium]|nr:hypothetical protein [Rikenellaceae bacterium]MCL2692061.1 hypothetical protein [Rikenellaceae bacterium]
MACCLDWYNFGATALLGLLTVILSALLIFFTVKISRRQGELQKQISDDQNQLQKLLAEKDVKVAMYQHRINCYLQVMKALDIVIYSKLGDVLDVFDKGSIKNIEEKTQEGRWLLCRSFIESEVLFDQDINAYIGAIYEKYDKLYCIFCDMVTIPNNESEKRQKQLLTVIGATSSDSKETIFLKYVSFMKSPEHKDIFINIYPELKDYSKIINDLRNIYKPRNELVSMMDKYINTNNW